MKPSDWAAGDENVARLLGQAYDPPAVSDEFARRVEARLLEVAAETARRGGKRPACPPITGPQASRLWLRTRRLAAVAALIGLIALGAWLTPRPRPLTPETLRTPVPLLDHRLVAGPRPIPAGAPLLSPGATLATQAGQRRRVALPDGSMLSLNQNTTVCYDTLRHLTLKAGEVFVELAPRLADSARSVFTVATPHRAIRAVGTRFLVRAGAEGTAVAVTQGQAHVSDCDDLLCAGQEVGPKDTTITPAPRASYLLDWTRDLVVSATGSLVPANPYAGGALVVHDSQGHTAPLSLRKYHIDVHVEDGFARTTIDQTYFNHTLSRLEGTFHFPLPADASLSRLAMYVDGTLMEGGMVEREYGRTVFEQIVTRMKDPALLEWVDGRTFKMRVFPLEPRQEKRIVLSYTQRLPSLYGRLSYRSPAGHSLGAVRDWSFHARVKDGANIDWRCDSHHLTPRRENGDLLLDASAHNVRMDRDIALDLEDHAAAAADAARFATAEQDGFRYLMLRYRPALSASVGRHRRDWVFLFESSADRDPLLARTQIEIIRTLLAHAEPDDTFAVLTADTRVRSFTPTLRRVTPENAAAALSSLEQTHLLGALDLDAALTAAADLLRPARNPYLVHVGSAQPVLGERRADVLSTRLPSATCYVGIGVGHRWGRGVMTQIADRHRGCVTQINPDEPVSWRTFDLLAALNTPRLLDVKVADAAGKTPFLCPTRTLAQGEELCAITRLPVNEPLPKSLLIQGTLDGQPFQCVQTSGGVHPRRQAAYLPRTWARLEIDRLLAEDSQKNKGQVIALSKAMYVMTPFTSLLVLENEAMYAQYKVDRGRKDHWAMYPCPPKIPVIREPLPPSTPAPSPDRNGIYFDPITRQPLATPEYVAWTVRATGLYSSNLESLRLSAYSLHDTYSMFNSARDIQDGTSNTIFFTIVPYIETGPQAVNSQVAMSDGSVRQVALLGKPKDWAVDYDPITGEPLSPAAMWWSLKRKINEEAESERAHFSDPEATERLFDALRADPVQSRRPSLWRLGARAAEQRHDYDTAMQRLQRALDLEAKQPAAVVSLDALRRDHAWLLTLAAKHIDRQTALRRPIAPDLVARIVSTADRWRTVEPLTWLPCLLAARALWRAGEHDLAWGYLTTPWAEADPRQLAWLETARQQFRQGKYDQVEQTFLEAINQALNPQPW